MRSHDNNPNANPRPPTLITPESIPTPEKSPVHKLKQRDLLFSRSLDSDASHTNFSGYSTDQSDNVLTHSEDCSFSDEEVLMGYK